MDIDNDILNYEIFIKNRSNANNYNYNKSIKVMFILNEDINKFKIYN